MYILASPAAICPMHCSLLSVLLNFEMFTSILPHCSCRYRPCTAGLAFAGIQKPLRAGDSWVGGSSANLGQGIYCAAMAVIFVALSLGDMYL